MAPLPAGFWKVSSLRAFSPPPLDSLTGFGQGQIPRLQNIIYRQPSDGLQFKYPPSVLLPTCRQVYEQNKYLGRI